MARDPRKADLRDFEQLRADYPMLRARPLFLEGLHVDALHHYGRFHLKAGQVYRIKAADEDEFVGKVKGLERYTPQNDCPTLALVTVVKMMTAAAVNRLLVEDLFLGEGEGRWAFTVPQGQYIETDSLMTVWETDLLEWLPVFSFEPTRRDMTLYPKPAAGRDWSRDDVKLSVRDDVEGTSYVLIEHVRRICTEKCWVGGQWRFAAGPWRCCVLCEYSQGRWYHQECLEEMGRPFSAEDARNAHRDEAATEGGLPAWINPLPDWNVADANDTYWETIRGMPIQRGYAAVGEPGLFSFERLLMAVRHEGRTPMNARGRVVELVMENTWKPADGLMSLTAREMRTYVVIFGVLFYLIDLSYPGHEGSYRL
ncbi:hypothetical protein OH76DRAFT_1490458 [Lentinus brumalis]|uniref:Uncharacterized protein n=1 Tax=Lentinus brumalis TaxID=2498619 RepID=A0A371CJ02_9APHY|nr:hypothetical protein OH76DRAFT_1490458 [Polyporus brumalis]